MRYKTIVKKKLGELRNSILSHSSSISMLKSPEELKDELERMLEKIHEIDVLLNTEQESF